MIARSARASVAVSGPIAVDGSASRDVSKPSKCTSPAKAMVTGFACLGGLVDGKTVTGTRGDGTGAELEPPAASWVPPVLWWLPGLPAPPLQAVRTISTDRKLAHVRRRAASLPRTLRRLLQSFRLTVRGSVLFRSCRHGSVALATLLHCHPDRHRQAGEWPDTPPARKPVGNVAGAASPRRRCTADTPASRRRHVASLKLAGTPDVVPPRRYGLWGTDAAHGSG